ncbi:sigma-54 dependent transcriptional regulator [Paracoccus sp. MKU1]|uniref:sigma-54-dependent transcriptional regulator n=1 Tax=Paracoccus sp. MKU1 TaxID=1745182 RepID=UPI0007193289|nr:sigma-54 dependent transcriptional regulator [Paracoccus sp. MKU1]KRW96884.1 Fis family transcriptional regulator [Paracoccus sp. MKU1]
MEREVALESQATAPAADRSDPLLRRASVLVIDDEPGMRNFLAKTLQPHCRTVQEAADVEAAGSLLERQRFDIVLLDNRMPGLRGIDWLVRQRRHGWQFEAIMITAFPDLDTAIEAMRAGAADFLPKPFRANQVLNAVRRSMELASLRRENLLLRHELDRARLSQRSQLLGSSPAIEAVRERLRRVAALPTPVLISGDSGTGKEEAARFLHSLSSRADRPFVPINCATIPADMLEMALFGHTPGVLHGTDQGRAGLFVSAEGGTVFFDEIAELPRPAQAALLRVLDKQTIRPVGSEREIALDLRFVFATGKSLAAEVEAGRFREDLFFRVNVLQIEMPPLTLRGTDTLDLAAFFMAGLAAELGLEPLEIDSPVRAALLRYPWPGNIRELRNFIERSLIFGRFPLETLGTAAPREIEPLEAVQRRHILQALELAGGNRSRAADWLGVSRKTIERKCASWGL